MFEKQSYRMRLFGNLDALYFRTSLHNFINRSPLDETNNFIGSALLKVTWLISKVTKGLVWQTKEH